MTFNQAMLPGRLADTSAAILVTIRLSLSSGYIHSASWATIVCFNNFKEGIISTQTDGNYCLWENSLVPHYHHLFNAHDFPTLLCCNTSYLLFHYPSFWALFHYILA